MKYIRKYEEIEFDDFSKIKYWRWKNHLVDSIMIVEFSEDYPSKVKISFFNLQSSDIISQDWFDNNTLLHLMNMKKNNPSYILRPATEDEINDFELKILANKYNL